MLKMIKDGQEYEDVQIDIVKEEHLNAWISEHDHVHVIDIEMTSTETAHTGPFHTLKIVWCYNCDVGAWKS